MADDPRKFYYRRRNSKQRNIVKNQKKQVNEKTDFEFQVTYYGNSYFFSFDSDAVPTEEDAVVIQHLVISGITCTDEEFEMFGNEVENSNNLTAIAIMAVLIEKITAVRAKVADYEAALQNHLSKKQEIQTLEDLHDALSQKPKTETETTMSNAKTTISSNETMSNSTQTNETTNAMTEAMNIATAKEAATTAANEAVEVVKETTKNVGEAAATIGATATMAAATGLVATKSFAARNKKKLLIAGGLLGLGVGGFFAYKRWGSSILSFGSSAAGAAVDAAEVVVDQVAA